MMMSSFSLFGLLGLPVLIAEWVGVLGLRRGPRGAAWWLMVAGVSLNTLAVLGQFAIYALLDLGIMRSRNFGDGWMYLFMFLPIGGNLLFAIGFALHGLRAASASQRQTELEQLVAAMSEEMSLLRKESPRP